MSNITEKQLEKVLQSIPQKKVQASFSDTVMQTIQQETQEEIQYLKPVLVSSSVLLSALTLWFGISLVGKLISSGFFDFLFLFFDHLFSRENHIDSLFTILINQLPLLFTIGFFVSSCLLISSTLLYRKVSHFSHRRFVHG